MKKITVTIASTSEVAEEKAAIKIAKLVGAKKQKSGNYTLRIELPEKEELDTQICKRVAVEAKKLKGKSKGPERFPNSMASFCYFKDGSRICYETRGYFQMYAYHTFSPK